MTTRGRLTVVALVVVGLGASWWLFGFSTYRLGDSSLTMCRFFGRVTRIDSYVVAKGKAYRERRLFSWSEPFVNGNSVTDCGAIHPEVWQDLNGDGRWDTWLFRVGPDSSGHCQVEYRVDTKGTGRPD
jgi:hypothetical protein